MKEICFLQMCCENSPCKVEGTLENEEHMMKSDAVDDSHKMDAACTNGMCMGLVFQIKQEEPSMSSGAAVSNGWETGVETCRGNVTKGSEIRVFKWEYNEILR